MKWRSAVLLTVVLAVLSGCGSPSPRMPEGEIETEIVEETRGGREREVTLETTDKEEGKAGERAETAGQEISAMESSGETVMAGKEQGKRTLTREKVLELAGREDLTWADFEDYASQDVGFGMRILHYQIDRDFSVAIGGGGTDQEPMYIRLGAGDDYLELRESSAEAVEEFFEKYGSRAEYVGIRGHIKEAKGDAALISSDTDQFPGVFWVTGLRELAAEEELKGGTSVFVLMEDTGEEEADGIRRFAGKELVALSHEEERAQVDVLLTSPPPLTLTDALSGRYDPFEVQPGNCKWGELDENGEAKEIVACGSAPLDERMLKDRAKLKLPVYNKMDKVFYTFSTVIDPDRLVIRQWKASDAGRMDAEEESITILYYVIPIAGLEKDKIYEFTAEWDKENIEKNGFWGNASYVLTTE